MDCPKCGATLGSIRDVNVTIEMIVTCPGDIQQGEDGSNTLSVMFWDQCLEDRSVVGFSCKCGQPLNDSTEWRRSHNLMPKYETVWIDD